MCRAASESEVANRLQIFELQLASPRQRIRFRSQKKHPLLGDGSLVDAARGFTRRHETQVRLAETQDLETPPRRVRRQKAQVYPRMFLSKTHDRVAHEVSDRRAAGRDRERVRLAML